MTQLQQLLRYMCVGAVGTSVDIMVFMMLTSMYSLDYRAALCVSFMVGVFCNYCLCDMFIFQRIDQPFLRACVRHYAASMTGLFFHQIGMFMLVSWWHMQQLAVARLIVAALTFLFNFTLIRRFVFRLHH